MKIKQTELVYVPKDLCSSALYWMSINDKDTIMNMITPMMIDCFSIVRLPYLNLSVMFYEVDCMTFNNNCTRQLVSTVLCKNPIERKKLTNYISIDEFPHNVAISDQATHKKRGSTPVRSDSMGWHDIIAITNRFDNLIRGGVYVPACRLHVPNCDGSRFRQSSIIAHSSVYNTGEMAVMNTELHDRWVSQLLSKPYTTNKVKK